MKIKRQKKVNRFLSFFKNHFGFREPFQVLMDGTFCQSAIKTKMLVRDQLVQYLGGNVKLLTTCCAILETEKLGTALRGAGLILKQLPVHSCGHEKEPKCAFWCFMDMLSNRNPNRYMIATQDEDMRAKLRKRVAIPLLYVHHGGPILERPSFANRKKAEVVLHSRLRPQDHQIVILNELKKKFLVDEQAVRKRRKRILGPNPLSCKPKKVKKTKASETKEETNKKSRKRRRIKIADHVKEHLAQASTSTSS